MSVEDGEVLKGQLIDKDHRAIIPYEQQMRRFNNKGHAPEIGQAGAEVNPVDIGSSEVKRFDYSGLDATRLGIFYSNPTFVSFRLPQELIGLTSTFSTSKGVGAGANNPHAGASGASWSVGISASNQATSSLDYIADVQPIVKTYDASNVPCIECYFYTSGTVTMAEVLTRLTAELGATVNVWPAFKAVAHTITVKGQSTSVSSTAKVQIAGSVTSSGGTITSVSASDDSGYDYSILTRSVIRSVDLPPYLHGELDIDPYTMDDTITVTAAASLTGTGDLVGTVTGGTTVPPQTVTASISPHHFDATSPAGVPTTGLYLQGLQPQFSDGDLFLQRAIVVDFAYFA